jgi:glutamine synthetase
MDKEEVLEKIKAAKIDTVRIDFSDMHGVNRGKIVPARRMEEVFEEGINCAKPTFSLDLNYNVFSGSGTGEEVDYADMTIIPDPATFSVVPYQEKTARLIGDIHVGEAPFPFCPRGLLKRVLKRYRDMGLEPIVAVELEFYVFRQDGAAFEYYCDRPSNVYTMNPRVDPSDLMRSMQNCLLDMGFEVLYCNHEFFQGQYEINWKHTDALTVADQAATFKAVCKELAAINNLYATFMGRPKNEMGGSGCHLHFSINDPKTGKNLFDDPNGKEGMSDLMRHFIAGQLAHAKGMTPFFAPNINSYRRYKLNSFAPYYLAWGLDNRTTYIRVPRERGKATRAENRAPCASANPYLAVALGLISGLEGIKQQMNPGDFYVGDLYQEAPGMFETMPLYLHEAVRELQNDALLCEAIGPEIVQNFTTMKLGEAERFRTHVNDWEFAEYSYHL